MFSWNVNYWTRTVKKNVSFTKTAHDELGSLNERFFRSDKFQLFLRLLTLGFYSTISGHHTMRLPSELGLFTVPSWDHRVSKPLFVPERGKKRVMCLSVIDVRVNYVRSLWHFICSHITFKLPKRFWRNKN